MKVFVAGATGALGIPLTRQLIARGHEVLGLVRDPASAAGLWSGASSASSSIASLTSGVIRTAEV